MTNLTKSGFKEVEIQYRELVLKSDKIENKLVKNLLKSSLIPIGILLKYIKNKLNGAETTKKDKM